MIDPEFIVHSLTN